MIDRWASGHWRETVPAGADARTPPAPLGPVLGIDAATLMAIAMRRKGAIAAAGFLAAILTYLALHTVPPTYLGKTQVLLGADASPTLGIPNVVPEANANLAFTESAVIVLQSTDVLRAVVRELGLDQRKEFNPALQETGPIEGAVDLLRAAMSHLTFSRGNSDNGDIDLAGERDPLAGTIRGLRKTISVRVLGESQVIEIRAQSTSPRIAAAIADTIAQKYIHRRLEAKYLAGDQATEWLAGRANELREILKESEQAVASFRKGLIIGDPDTVTDPEPLIEALTASLAQLTNEMADLQARRNEIVKLLEAGNFLALAQILDVPAFADLLAELSDIDDNIVRLRARFGEHASIQRLRSARNQIETRLRNEVVEFLSGLDVRIGVVADRGRILRTQLEETRVAFAELQQANLQLAELMREAEASREVYNTFLLRLKETRERSQFQSADARIVSAAEVPVFPAAPQKTKLSVIFAVAGSLVALLFFAFFGDNRPKVTDPRQVSLSTGVRSVRQIPYRRGAKTPFGLLNCVTDAPDSPEAEAMRRLCTSVAAKDPTQANIIMITSVEHGEGKTTIALSLAETFACEGFSTVLVSADPSNGSLEELLLHRNASAIGFDFVDCTGQLNPGFDGSGHMEDEFPKLLRKLKRRKVIILDTPPVMASADVFDMGILANHTIVTCAWDQTPNESLEQCIQELQDCGVGVRSIAINKVPKNRIQQGVRTARPAAPPRALPSPQPAE